MKEDSLSAEPAAPPVTARERSVDAHGRRVLSPRVAYVMSRFPKLSETFVLFEMLWMQRHDVDVSVYPLLLERTDVLHAEARQLVKRAHVAKPLSASTMGAIWHYLRRDPGKLLSAGTQVIRATAAPRRAFLANLGTLPRAAWMAREMEREGIEHIHAHFATSATTAAYVINRLTGIPFSFTAHAQDIYLNQRMLAEKVRAAAFVVTISEFNKRFITAIAGLAAADKIHVIHCGVDIDLFQPPDHERRPGPFRIACIGRLVEMKGQTHLVEACRRLAGDGIAYQCSIVGAGPCRQALERQIVESGLSDRVTLLGAQPREVVLATIRDADAVVLPAIVTKEGRMEGISVALMESLACERAVVGTNISGIPELVIDGVTGLLVEPGDATALAAALKRLESDPALREQLGQAGRLKVIHEFDLDTNSASLRELFSASQSNIHSVDEPQPIGRGAGP